MNISAILNEEICKFLINENLSSLAQLSNELDSLVKRVCKIPTNNMNKNAINSIYKVEYYSMQIIFAIKRCVSSNSLNESLSSWGIDLPPELFGNFYNYYINGYRNTKNWLERKNGSNSNVNSNAESSNMASNMNQSNVRSEKLSVLLSRVGKMEQTYYNEESAYNIARTNPNISKGIRGIFQKIKEIYQQYQLLQSQIQNNSQVNP